MKLASWNVNSLKVRLPHLSAWLETARPEVLGLQELKLVDAQFPHAPLEALGYRAAVFGQPTYNGVALLTQAPLEGVERGIPGFDDVQARVIVGRVNGLTVVNCYVVNGQSIDSDKYPYKLAFLRALHGYLSALKRNGETLVVMGDFNIAPADIDCHDPAAWAGQVLCSEPERAALKEILDLGLNDSFRLLNHEPKLYSWWDYRMLAFRRNQGLRIDLVLTDESLRGRVNDVGIDKAPRKLERPSDHAPVWANV
jgi:exodeoxyribonuclease III